MQSIIIDDADKARVDFSDRWDITTQGHAPEFRDTTHGTNTTGATMKFKFQGTFVSVYGTIDDPVISQYSVDGSSPSVFVTPTPSSPAFHQLFYASPLLEDGSHELVMTYTGKQGNKRGYLWVDYIIFTPSNTVVVDDTDSAMKWTGQWNVINSGAPVEHQKTTHGAGIGINGLRLDMEFTGTRVSFWGTIDASQFGESAVLTYVIDGGPEMTASIPGSSKLVFHYQFWQSPLLSDGAHTITATVKSVSAPIWLDYALLASSNDPISPIASSVSASGTALPSGSASQSASGTTLPSGSASRPTSTGASTSASTTSANPGTTETKSSNAGLIGGVVGGVVGGLLILALLFFLWRRRSRQNNAEQGGSTEKITPAHPSQAGFNHAAVATTPYQFNPVPVATIVTSSRPSLALSDPPTDFSPYAGLPAASTASMGYGITTTPHRDEKRRQQLAIHSNLPPGAAITPAHAHSQAGASLPPSHQDASARLDMTEPPPAYQNHS